MVTYSSHRLTIGKVEIDCFWCLIGDMTPNDHLGLIFLFNYTFYSHYNKDWIANTEIGLDPNNSVIKRLWCMFIE